MVSTAVSHRMESTPLSAITMRARLRLGLQIVLLAARVDRCGHYPAYLGLRVVLTPVDCVGLREVQMVQHAGRHHLFGLQQKLQALLLVAYEGPRRRLDEHLAAHPVRACGVVKAVPGGNRLEPP